jgi:hypothetical protein
MSSPSVYLHVFPSLLSLYIVEDMDLVFRIPVEAFSVMDETPEKLAVFRRRHDEDLSSGPSSRISW